MSNTIINGGASPYPKHVGPSAIASFSDGAQDAPLKSLKFSIEPSQDLHGYSYPWPGGGGKNLLPELSATVTQNGVTATKNADGTLHVTTTTVTANTEIVIGSVTRDNTKSYAVSGCPTGGSTSTYRQIVRLYSGTTSLQTLTDSGSGYIIPTTLQPTADSIRVAVWIASGQNNLNLTFKPMVEIGSSVTAYAPYSNISPISGWSQVDGAAAGKNLAVLEAIGAINLNTGELQTTSSSTYARTGKVKCLPNTAYTASGGWPITQFIIGYYDANDNYLGYAIPSTPASGVSNTSFTTHASAGYMVVIVRRGANTSSLSDFPQFQLEQGSTASPYAASTLTPITIQLGQTVYGGTVDALSGKLVIDRVGVAITNANEIGANHYAPIWRINYNNAASTAKAPASTSVTNIMCNAFKAVGEANRGQPGTCFISGSSKWIQFDFSDTGIADANAAKTYFLSLNPFIVYELATPIEVDLTPVSVNSLLGQNNIWASCGNTELDYYPAAASVVAVLNRSSKVYTSIPLGKIRYDTYQTTPNQALDLDSYRAETGVLIRNVLSHTATKIEFNTPSMTNAQWEEVWNIIKAGFNNSTERKLKLKYYDQMSATYKTGWFYVPDVNFTIRNIDEANGIINYDEIRVAFIEY